MNKNYITLQTPTDVTTKDSRGEPYSYYVPGMDPDRSTWNLIVGLAYLIVWVVGIPVLLYAAVRWWSAQDHDIDSVRETISESQVWEYERQDLRDANMFIELHCQNVHPRTLFRQLKRETQEITSGEVFKYTTREPDTSNPSVVDETVGQQSGRVVARFIADTDWQQFQEGEQTQHSIPILPIIFGALGAILLTVGLAVGVNNQVLIIGLGILALLLAAYLYYRHNPSSAPVRYEYRKRVRVLVEGEIGEQVSDPETPTSLVATDLDIIIGEDIETRRKSSTTTSKVPLAEFSKEMRQELISNTSPLPSELPFHHVSPNLYTRRKMKPI